MRVMARSVPTLGTTAILAGLILAGCGGSSEPDDTTPDGGDTDTDTDTDSGADSGADAGSDTDTDADTDCGGIELPYAVEPASLLVLLDRSHSMYSSTIGDVTHAELVQLSLSNFAEEETELGRIDFGLTVFPSMSCPAGAADAGVDEQCAPAADSPDPGFDAPLVPIGPDNYFEITTLVAAIGQCGGTPICGTLEWAYAALTDPELPEEVADGPIAALLITDGAPNCNAALDVDTCAPAVDGVDPTAPEECLDDACSYDAALALYLAGIDLYVVGVGEEAAAFAEVMQGIAYYGGAYDPDDETVPAEPPLWYPAGDAPALDAALAAIADGLDSCSFAIDWDDIPDISPDPPYEPIEKACDQVSVSAPADTSGEVSLFYSADCSGEDPDFGLYAWRWVGIEAELDDLADYGLDQCTVIELCPEACARGWSQPWSWVDVGFG